MMAADLILQDLTSGEIPLSLRCATKEPCIRRDGRKPHIASLFRWAGPGVRGVVLETCRVGATLCTTRPALLRFIHRLSDPAAGTSDRSPVDRGRAHARAEADLQRAGI
jgi:hypothetical protein